MTRDEQLIRAALEMAAAETEECNVAAIRAQMEALDGHTPGPFHIRTLENFGWNIVHYQGGSLHDFLRVAKAALEQDARLIAAAPDMRATILALCDAQDSLCNALDEARSETERLRAVLAPCVKMLDDLVSESGRGVDWGHEDAFRMGEWFEAHDMDAIGTARAALAAMDSDDDLR